MGDGQVEVLEVPSPVVTPDTVLVEIRASLLSAGTERAKVQTARQGLIGKARSRPDQVAKVVESARRDGISDTVRAVRMRLQAPDVLGYSAAGVVLEVGGNVPDVAPGDHVACGGASAVHAEVDRVPGNLCVPIPVGLDFEIAAFATVGSIAMHGVRQADVRLGERVAVIGLGLVGQLAGQLLRAAGCSVVGIDLDEGLVSHAVEHGAVDAGFGRSELDGPSLPAAATGCDAVLITAATKSQDPIELAAKLSRDRGRVVVVGDVGLAVPRAPYYDKELDLRLSRSYGPGRYDREYEERGLDYPIGYVRWTERRNMAAFVELAAAGKVDVSNLITDRVDVENAPEAYQHLATSATSPLAVILRYPHEDAEFTGQVKQRLASAAPTVDGRSVGVIGAGSFSERILVSGLQSAGFALTSIASASGLSAEHLAGRSESARAADPAEIFEDPAIDVVAIATRHASHCELALRALEAGKAVFVEKPPALDMEGLDALEQATLSGPPLAVGFNRRHAPMAVAMREHVAGRGSPVQLIYRVNAGSLPAEHWLNDITEGGGRLVGEGCHFVDFACWFAGDIPTRVSCFVRPEPGQPLRAAQSFTVALEFADGSLATILYEAGGATGLGKEYAEAHGGGRSAALDDFQSLKTYEGRRGRRQRGLARGKGHDEQFQAFAQLLRGEAAPPAPSHLSTMRATLAADRSAESGRAVEVKGGEVL